MAKKGQYLRKREILLDDFIEKSDADSIYNLINLIEEKYGIKNKVAKIIIEDSDSESIPCSIFSKDCGISESIVKYLRENKSLTNKHISRILAKKENNIAVSYLKTRKKISKKYSDFDFSYKLPFSSLVNKKLTAFESSVIFFRDNKGYSFTEISSILKRDTPTVWITYSRATLKNARP